VEQIEGIRDLLLRAVASDPALPESHYHLARYYHYLSNAAEERVTLETAIRTFDAAPEGSIRRITYRIDTQKRYADILINNREFFPAEEQLVKGVGIFEDAFARRLLSRSPEFGRLYAGLGDIEYFTKAGNMEMALQYYRRSEQHGWAPPEMRYRMGSAYYHLEEWRDALEQFFTASAELPLNRRLLYALGNVSYQRGDYFAAQGYYNRLLDILETERSRLPLLLPNDEPEFIELAERLMIARNNMGATYESLAEQTGDSRYRSRALALYSESARAWDTLTRNPQTMIRSLPAPGIFGPGVNLPYLNSRNALYPQPGYEPQIFLPIDKDVLEPSAWERLVPQAGHLSPE
jgi:tetratricopeptide (TPR) repeat protein